jgi:hypothetical protein
LNPTDIVSKVFLTKKRRATCKSKYLGWKRWGQISDPSLELGAARPTGKLVTSFYIAIGTNMSDEPSHLWIYIYKEVLISLDRLAACALIGDWFVNS